jgi:SAM-dependent methyltransferase
MDQPSVDRETFAARQAQMTSNWYENVKRREGDVNAYIAKRHQAYLRRWSEAGRFIPDGAKLLDIGGGNLYPALFQYLQSRKFDYHYLDVDPACVSSNRDLGSKFGFAPEKFSEGFNDRFDFASGEMDAVFSSHCIEHSYDLHRTFLELHRILKPGGYLTMAVPMGWETNPEHPYFLGAQHWRALVQDAGFEITVAQEGCDYPESGYDLFIAARKNESAAKAFRLDAKDFRKESYAFVPIDDPRVSYSKQPLRTTEGDAYQLRGSDWRITFKGDSGLTEVVPILLHHAWSAIVRIFDAPDSVTHHDLYSPFSTVQPVRHRLKSSSKTGVTLSIEPTGKNPCSWSTEGVLHGFMVR